MKSVIAFATATTAVVFHEHAATNTLINQVYDHHFATLECTSVECATQLQEDMQKCTTPLMRVMSKQECQSITQALAGMGGTVTSQVEESLDALCGSSCFGQLKTAMKEYGACIEPLMADMGAAGGMDIGAMLDGAFDFMCLKNGAGKYCIAEMTTFSTMQAQVAYSSDITDICDSMSSMGCCMSSLLEYSQGILGSMDATSSYDLASAIPCSLPPACLGFNQVATYKSASFDLDASLFANFDTDNLDLLAAIRKDISALSGVALTDITAEITITGSVATVVITVRGETDTITATYDLSGLSGGALTNLQTAVGSAAPLTVSASVTTAEGVASGTDLVVDSSPAAILLPASAVLVAVCL